MLVAHAKRRIHAPAEMVYALLSEPEQLPLHGGRLRRVEVSDAEASRVRVAGWFALWPFRAEYRVTRWPGLGCQHDLVAGTLAQSRCQCYVQTVRGFTQLVHVEEVDLRPPFSALERWLRPYVQYLLDREVDRVKRLVEAALIARLRSPGPG